MRGVAALGGNALLERGELPLLGRSLDADARLRFVEATGKMAAIGQLGDAEALLRGDAGTMVAV